MHMFKTWQFWLAAVVLAGPLWVVLTMIIGNLLHLINLMLIRRQNHFGIYIEDHLKGKAIFVPCSDEAKRVLHRHAKTVKGPSPWLFGSRIVPAAVEKELYELCSHDPETPQCMIRPIALRFGGGNVTIIDT